MKVILILFFILLLNCSTQIVSKNHGISSLDKKYNKITIKESNKNDIIELIGPPSIKNKSIIIKSWQKKNKRK